MTNQDPGLVPLLKLCLAKHRRSDWESLADRLQPVVSKGVRRALARFALAGDGLANDLVQDVFLKLFEKNFAVLRACRAENDGALQVYLATIAASTVTDYYRSRSSEKKGSGRAEASLENLENVLSAADDPLQAAERQLLLERIERCLEPQKERSRTVFWLYHRHGYKPKNIAALPGIGMACDGVETLLHRLTIAVRDCLRKSGVLKEMHPGEGAGA